MGRNFTDACQLCGRFKSLSLSQKAHLENKKYLMISIYVRYIDDTFIMRTEYELDMSAGGVLLLVVF